MADDSKLQISPVPEAPVEGLLRLYAGAVPPAPEWFTRAINTPHEEHRVAVEGADIHYLRWGDITRPGLLLLHGNAAHAHWWTFIAPFLARDYNVAAMSLSGMGDSGRREEYSMKLFAREAMAVCEHARMFEHVEPPIIVGHSFGGFVTILIGALYGERLAGTVLVDSPVNPPERQRKGPQREPRPHRVYPELTEALGRFRLAPPQDCENHFILDYIARHSLEEVEGGWSWKFDPRIWRRFSIGDTSERLRATKCRIGIFRGEYSAIFPPEIGDYMYDLLGKAVPVVEIPEARHHIMLDQPLAFVAALRALLADWDHSISNRRVASGKK
jgi:pimeloyl-ACP methyl ester carboxylesterase